jgi:hypothetical protein
MRKLAFVALDALLPLPALAQSTPATQSMKIMSTVTPATPAPVIEKPAPMAMPDMTPPPAPPVNEAPVVVAKADEVQGSITLVHWLTGKSEPLVIGAPVAGGDVLKLEAGSRTKVTFHGGTEIVVAGAGSLQVDEFVYDEAAPKKNKALFTAEGVNFSYAPGLVDRAIKADVAVRFENGAVGVRGAATGKLYRNGTHFYSEGGDFIVRDDAGEVGLATGYGTVITARNAQPAPPRAWTGSDVDVVKSAVK